MGKAPASELLRTCSRPRPPAPRATPPRARAPARARSLPAMGRAQAAAPRPGFRASPPRRRRARVRPPADGQRAGEVAPAPVAPPALLRAARPPRHDASAPESRQSPRCVRPRPRNPPPSARPSAARGGRLRAPGIHIALPGSSPPRVGFASIRRWRTRASARRRRGGRHRHRAPAPARACGAPGAANARLGVSSLSVDRRGGCAEWCRACGGHAAGRGRAGISGCAQSGSPATAGPRNHSAA